ncbi:PqiA/YebS family transporter subunit [Shewanella sp. GXUN23E]|uniref:PqiA/YebS family transporter subunit n=1 Tax=Shewanella sp. GXUN23E TaxID=3422498 RepID=UPI003D7D33BF
MTNHTQTLAACAECGMVTRVPELQPGQTASCPRCDHTLTSCVPDCRNKVFAYSTAALILLAVSCFFPFMEISVQDIHQKIVLLDALSVFYYFNNGGVASLLVITIVLLPVLYLCGLILLFFLATRRRVSSPAGNRPAIKFIYRFVFGFEPWLLADIFFIGVLVSIIKMASMTDIDVGIAFWTYLLFTLLLVKSSRTVDRTWLCSRLFAPVDTGDVRPGDTHLTGNHLVCHLCGQINPLTAGHTHCRCRRCNCRLHEFNPRKSIHISAALLLTSLIFYFPANLYPMMFTTSFGDSDGSTIMDGVIMLWKMGSYPIALVILTASIILPLTKMLILAHLLWSQHKLMPQSEHSALEKLKLYRFIELIGRWSMIDVFVVAILTALVQFGELMRVTPGSAVFYFALVVVFTLIATHRFDPRILWQLSETTAIAHSDAAYSNPQREQHG